jgi:RND family efflux transporter MFP subunit
MKEKVQRLLVCGGIVLMLAVPAFFPVRAEEAPCAIELEGILEPSEIVQVSSQVPGILSELLVDRGDFVKKGDVLARLYSGVEQAAAELAKARVDFGKRKVERNEELYKKQLISIHEKDEMATEVIMGELQEKEAMERLNLRTIRSTVDGVVVERMGAPGAYVGEGPFMTLAKINPLYVEVVAPVTYFGAIEKGMAATIKPEAPVSGEYPVKIVVVDRVIDAASGTFGVRLLLENPGNKLPSGLKCTVCFPAP